MEQHSSIIEDTSYTGFIQPDVDALIGHIGNLVPSISLRNLRLDCPGGQYEWEITDVGDDRGKVMRLVSVHLHDSSHCQRSW